MRKVAVAANTSFREYNEALADSLRATATDHKLDVLTLPFPLMKEALDGVGIKDGKVLDDTVRGMLALESCRFAKNRNIPLAIVDFQSSTDFVERLESAATTQNIFFAEQQGDFVSHAKREATMDAIRVYNPENVAWMELEKTFLMGNIPSLAEQVPKNGMVIPYRNVGLGILTYPGDQIRSEVLTNYAVQASLGQKLWPYKLPPDLMGGSRIFAAHGEIAELMVHEDIPDHLRGDKYTGDYAHLMLLPIKAMKRGIPVIHQDVSYFHPSIQSELEFRSTPERIKEYAMKRDRQMEAVIKMCYRELDESEEHIQWTLGEMRQRMALFQPDIETWRDLGPGRRERW